MADVKKLGKRANADVQRFLLSRNDTKEEHFNEKTITCPEYGERKEVMIEKLPIRESQFSTVTNVAVGGNGGHGPYSREEHSPMLQVLGSS